MRFVRGPNSVLHVPSPVPIPLKPISKLKEFCLLRLISLWGNTSLSGDGRSSLHNKRRRGLGTEPHPQPPTLGVVDTLSSSSMRVVGSSVCMDGSGLSTRNAIKSSLLMNRFFFFAHVKISLVLFLCPYLIPLSIHCLHTSADPMEGYINSNRYT